MSERERFEKHAEGRRLPLDVMIDGTYYYANTHEAWLAWQAACPEGWHRCVPVEPDEAMIEAALDAYMPFGDMALAIQAAIACAPRPGDAE